VLERQPDRIRAFLLQTSILERLCGSLCDAVTGDSDGQGMLEELERANLFLVPLDVERRWWRLHHLFADLLPPGWCKRSRTWCPSCIAGRPVGASSMG
jgi:LuxR family transcriptional regulator, maltose regulon positive regulatory protein